MLVHLKVCLLLKLVVEQVGLERRPYKKKSGREPSSGTLMGIKVEKGGLFKNTGVSLEGMRCYLKGEDELLEEDEE